MIFVLDCLYKHTGLLFEGLLYGIFLAIDLMSINMKKMEKVLCKIAILCLKINLISITQYFSNEIGQKNVYNLLLGNSNYLRKNTFLEFLVFGRN